SVACLLALDQLPQSFLLSSPYQPRLPCPVLLPFRPLPPCGFAPEKLPLGFGLSCPSDLEKLPLGFGLSCPSDPEKLPLGFGLSCPSDPEKLPLGFDSSCPSDPEKPPSRFGPSCPHRLPLTFSWDLLQRPSHVRSSAEVRAARLARA